MPDNSAAEGPVFFDTNILLYLFDRSSNEKRRVAGELFRKHQRNGDLRLSLQVVHEFAANLLSRKFGVRRETVVELVSDLLALNATVLRGQDTLAALALMGELSLSFWDALIFVAAKREGCRFLYSEDFQHGRMYDTVTAINPFHEY